jgi:hypothetical protein
MICTLLRGNSDLPTFRIADMGSPRAAHAISYTSAGAHMAKPTCLVTMRISFAIVIAAMQQLGLGSSGTPWRMQSTSRHTAYHSIV